MSKLWMGLFYLCLADAMLVFHALIVLFNVVALPVTWLGHFRAWKFVRNFYFRTSHLLLIGFIAAESLLGSICPLTRWEDALRAKAGVGPLYEGGFLAHWVHRLMFYDLDETVFMTGYVLFFVLVVFTLVWIKPQAPAWFRRHKPQPLATTACGGEKPDTAHSRAG